MKFSIIIPVYNSQNILKKLIDEVIFEISKISNKYEIILIDDCSKDYSWKVISQVKKKERKIKAIKNKKNIGQHPSIFKGMKKSKGENIFIMDCDLQDNPKYFKFFLKNRRDIDNVVVGLMNSKSAKKRHISKFFWFTLSLFSKYKFPTNITNFTLLSGKQAKKLLKIRNVGFLYGDICRLNMKTQFVELKKRRRYLGKSSYTFIKVIKLAIFWLWTYLFNTGSIYNEKKN